VERLRLAGAQIDPVVGDVDGNVDRVLDAYRDAAALPGPTTTWQRTGVFLGALPADLGPVRPAARRLPSLARDRGGPRGRAGR
jgi:hypothetical protein